MFVVIVFFQASKLSCISCGSLISTQFIFFPYSFCEAFEAFKLFAMFFWMRRHCFYCMTAYGHQGVWERWRVWGVCVCGCTQNTHTLTWLDKPAFCSGVAPDQNHAAVLNIGMTHTRAADWRRHNGWMWTGRNKSYKKKKSTHTNQGVRFCNNPSKLTCVVRLEVENVGLPCKGVHVVHLVILILIWVDQIDNIISWKGRKKLQFGGRQLHK